MIDALAALIPSGIGSVQIEHFAANERAGAFYDREGFAGIRIDRHDSDDRGLDVMWRSRAIRRS